MSHKQHFLVQVFIFFCMVSMLFFSKTSLQTVPAASGYSFVVLSSSAKTLDIGDQFCLLAVTSNGLAPKFSSSDSGVASVNTYGIVTAKKAGKATITAKISGGEASCKITVSKTSIVLSKTSVSLENGSCIKLTAAVSTGHAVSWKSSKTSIASVNSDGTITAKKPGSTTITATADKTSVTCRVTVKTPTVKLDKASASIYRTQTLKLTVSSTSKSTPKWKSNKKSVATVDNNGRVTAIKHGTAIITVTIDNVSKTCEVTVLKPVIRFQPSSVTLHIGEVYTPSLTVSSGNKPEYSSSNINRASVDSDGKITARQPGKVYIYASEDGTKESLIVTIQ